jgi:hypothetical protein
VPGLQLHVRGRVSGGSLVCQVRSEERVYPMEAAHNAEVAGSNPRPRYLERTPVAGPFLFCVNRTAYTQPMSASLGTHGRGSSCSTSMW